MKDMQLLWLILSRQFLLRRPKQCLRAISKTTRMRDFYDLFELWRIKGKEVSLEDFRKAILATCTKRNTLSFLGCTSDVVHRMRVDKKLKLRWAEYAAKHTYAEDISFAETLDALEDMLEKAGIAD
ncbi:MAG: nucleotidyl transferase AbiEii/AbiGii toxin family protein [Atopobiaceae bacterium]